MREQPTFRYPKGIKIITGRHLSREVYVYHVMNPALPNATSLQHLDLAASLRVKNHSPDGFNWGYDGSGPAQLALALMLLFVGPNEALPLYQTFKHAEVSHWDQGADWQVHGPFIHGWIRGQQYCEELDRKNIEEGSP